MKFKFWKISNIQISLKCMTQASIAIFWIQANIHPKNINAYF